MNQNELLSLKRFYEKLHDNIVINRKSLVKKSILLTFLNIKANTRTQLLRDSSIPSYRIPSDTIPYLERNSLIRKTESAGKYSITAKGIWEIESNNNKINIPLLLDYLDGKLFNPFEEAEKSISDRHKVVLLSMIAARSFSSESPIDLKTSDKTLDSMKETIDDTYNILKSLKVIKKLEYDDLFGKKGNEHEVSNLIRHTDSLYRLTRGIYRAAGKQQYFLDIYQNGEVSKDLLKILFEKIFENKELNTHDIQLISDFCKDVAHNKSIFIFEDIKKHIFSKTRYDDIITDTLYLVV
jgi:hypothetical protein